jgi:5-methylcytosine-specific restriction endonuclease McrA
MAEIKYWQSVLENAPYRFNEDYGLTYLDKYSYNKLNNALLKLKNLGYENNEFYIFAGNLIKHYHNNHQKIKDLNALNPRIVAQKFIGKKNIREFIFKRDKFKCLKCKSNNKLCIDHIMPISKGGENVLFNLQTLCHSCNSAKGSKYIDYRNNYGK